MLISDNGESIYLIFDACHMIKLVCNTFATYKVQKYKGKKIEWRYIQELHNYQQKEHVWLANKVKKAHIQFDKKIMNVRLAVQTLSNSTAAAIDHLREDLKLPEFQDSETTTLFIRIFDKLFDVFNTKSFVGKFHKKPLTIANQCRWEGVLAEAEKFIPELTDAHGTPILETRRKTGFIGFLLNIKSLRGIFNRFVVDGPLRFLLTYKLSQDHLEVFFGYLRARGACDNNPTTTMFRHIYKRVLSHAVTKGIGGNCMLQDETQLLRLSETKDMVYLNKKFDVFAHDIDTVTLSQLDNSGNLTDGQISVAGYVSGFVLTKIKKLHKCATCISALESANKPINTLIERKSYGFLKHTNQDFKAVCEYCELTLQHIIKTEKSFETDIFRKACVKILQDVFEKNSRLFEDLDAHSQDFLIFGSYKTIVVKL